MDRFLTFSLTNATNDTNTYATMTSQRLAKKSLQPLISMTFHFYENGRSAAFQLELEEEESNVQTVTGATKTGRPNVP